MSQKNIIKMTIFSKDSKLSDRFSTTLVKIPMILFTKWKNSFKNFYRIMETLNSQSNSKEDKGISYPVLKFYYKVLLITTLSFCIKADS